MQCALSACRVVWLCSLWHNLWRDLPRSRSLDLSREPTLVYLVQHLIIYLSRDLPSLASAGVSSCLVRLALQGQRVALREVVQHQQHQGRGEQLPTQAPGHHRCSQGRVSAVGRLFKLSLKRHLPTHGHSRWRLEGLLRFCLLLEHCQVHAHCHNPPSI